MRIRLLCLSAVALAACNLGNLPLPMGHQLKCRANSDCPSGLVCDPDIAEGRCVAEIAPNPTVKLETDTLVGTRNDTFEFTAEATNAATIEWEYLAGASDTPVRLADTTNVVQHRFTELGTREFCDPDCEDAVAVRLKVTVRSAEGKVVSAETTLVVINDAPIADFGDDLFISEQGIASVTLDWCGGGNPDAGCTSSDPDGDQIQFLGFRQVDGPSVGALGDGGVVTFAPPQGAHRPLVFEGVVSDGISRTVGRITVNRGSHGWVAIGTIDSTFRVHPDFRAVQKWVSGASDGGSERFYGPTLIEPDGVGGWWIADSFTTPARSLVAHLDSTLRENVSDRFDVPDFGRSGGGLLSPLRSFVPPSAGRSGCLAFRRDEFDGGGPESGFARFSPGQALTVAHFSLKADGGFHQPVAVLPVGSTGNCWALRLDESEDFNATGGAVAQLTESGQWIGEQPLGGYPGPSAVEADGTLWVAERYPVPLPGGGFAQPIEDLYRTVLTKRSPQAGAAAQSFDLGMAHLVAIAASPDGGLWALESHANALVRIAPDGTLFETDAIVGGGSVFGGPAISVDPVSGDVWAIDPEAQALRRFKPEPDGGIRLMVRLDGDDLPEGQNKKSFSGQGDLAIDPVSGNVATFVGGDNVSYARFLLIPPHGKRIERIFDVQNTLNSQLRGDPTSGTHWVSDAYRVRRIDARSRVLVEVPNTFMGRINRSPPMVVDRRGRAWVVNLEGMPALRSILPDGSDGARVPLPFVPQTGFIVGNQSGTTLNEHGCFFTQNGVVRVNFALSPPTVTPLTVTEDVVNCAVNSSGDVWVFTTNNAMLGDITARLFRRNETMSNVSVVAETQLPNSPTGIMGAVAEEDGDTLYFGTWHFDTYFADLVRIRASDSSRAVLSVLQGNVLGVNVLGIPISLGSRRVCSAPVPACTELWVSNRVSELRRYDATGEELERFTLGTNEGPLDLVP